jgi:uncharacterized protein
MRFLFYSLVLLLAFAGTARIGAFALNKVAFGQKHETNHLKWVFLTVPPLLLGLTLLYIPLWFWLERDRDSLWARGGALWLAVAAGTGIYWIVHTHRKNQRPRTVEGVKSHNSNFVRLRKAHIPFLWLRKLGAHNDIYDLEITAHSVFVRDLPEAFDGYRIAFVTDTHVAGFMRRAFYRAVVEEINRRNVDLVLFGGDFVTWRRHILLAAELLMTDLRARDGIYAVLGNHDYWADADGVIAAFTARGARFIVNRSIPITRGGSTIYLAGVDEIYRGDPDPESAFAGVPADAPRIVLSHHPDIIDVIDGRRADLLLCGHTHGGQIRFPYFGAVIVPSVHEARYAEGFFRQRDVLMYVSRGLGAIPPLRILCRPELATFSLKRDDRFDMQQEER